MGDIVTVNAGSSSIKFGVFAPAGAAPLGLAPTLTGAIEGFGTSHVRGRFVGGDGALLREKSWPVGEQPNDPASLFEFALHQLNEVRPGLRPVAVGHRVVHGGPKFSDPAELTPELRAELKALTPLAPLHMPANLRGIAAAAVAFPGARQFACFDTAFHAGRPFHRAAYALPRPLYDEGVRRYGMHGLSYESVMRRLRLERPAVAAGRVVIAHLGNGASLCGVRNGRCVETTMGFTPADGLMMGTRAGQLDPGVLLYLQREKRMSLEAVERLITKESGLLGVSGVGPDMRDLLASADPHAQEAVAMFCYRLVYHVGALAACLCGLDALVFTAGIGEHAAPVRANVCRALAWLGVDLDPEANARHAGEISRPGSRVPVLVVPTDEDRMIARHAADRIGAGAAG